MTGNDLRVKRKMYQNHQHEGPELRVICAFLEAFPQVRALGEALCIAYINPPYRHRKIER